MLQRPRCFWSRALSVKKTYLWHVFSEKASLRRRPKRSMVQTFKLCKSSPKEKRPCMLQRPWCFWSRAFSVKKTCLWHVFSEKASLRRRPKRSMVQTFKLCKSSPKEKRPCMLQRPWCFWSRGLDLNQRPPGYEPGELPDCSTPHHATRFSEVVSSSEKLQERTIRAVSRMCK